MKEIETEAIIGEWEINCKEHCKEVFAKLIIFEDQDTGNISDFKAKDKIRIIVVGDDK